ncbi:MAG: gamma-glutamyl-gamma-aminobutyrate hydrolase family protein [Elusimicrobiota bacterium]
MKLIAITQNVFFIKEIKETRDSLDQRWAAFLKRCGILPLLIPNNPLIARNIISSSKPCGVLLTGGNTLAAYGGNTPERDKTELILVHYAKKNNLPLMGVCRGMQFIQHIYGIKLRKIKGHVKRRMPILINNKITTVNSFHRFGTNNSKDAFHTWAIARDGIVKAIKHRKHPITGIMWHPERNKPFKTSDIKLFKRIFNAE